MTDLSAHWNARNYVVIDVESNGQLTPEIIEIGLVLLNGDVIKEQKSWLVHATLPVLSRVTRIHGIKNGDLKSCPTIHDIAKEIESMVANRYLVAHNSHVDWNMLHREVPSAVPLGIIDTLRLARKMYPLLPCFKLGALVERFGIAPNEAGSDFSPHRASYDAMAAAKLFLYLMHSSLPPPQIEDLIRDVDVSRSGNREDLVQLSLFDRETKP